jgi:prepilin-type N-terminal cleavage/methylation domain-containing protein
MFNLIKQKGYTLAELLISLEILAVIACFTIPKVINAQQQNSYNTSVKEAVSTIAGAYQLYNQTKGSTTNSGIDDITQYMNYIALDSTSSIDNSYTNGTAATSCGSSSGVCLKLHSGARLQYWPSDSFAGKATTNGVPFLIDPDGRVTDGTTNGPGKSLYFFLYYNGRVTDYGNIPSGTVSSGGSWGPAPTQVPPWFKW